MSTPPLIDINNPGRLHFLDGLRGIAILLVVLYHTYSNAWIELVPYFYPSHDLLIIKYGSHGVPLFFIISGFVISMSLEKCKNFGDFMFKRWLRLFPAMLIASLLILITSPLLSARPLGTPYAMDLIPGITFITPGFFRTIFDNQQTMLEGGFWSLFVEVKFYIVAGLLYFTIGQKRMITALVIMFLSSAVFDVMQSRLPGETATNLKLIFDSLDYEYYGWFAAGALFYRYYSSKSISSFIIALIVAFISARALGGLISLSMLFATILISIIACSMVSKTLQKLLSNKVLVFLGFISYPLYLIHENATISIIVQLHRQYDWIPVYLLSILPILAMVLISWLIARYLEPSLKKFIKKLVLKIPIKLTSQTNAIKNV